MLEPSTMVIVAIIVLLLAVAGVLCVVIPKNKKEALPDVIVDPVFEDVPLTDAPKEPEVVELVSEESEVVVDPVVEKVDEETAIRNAISSLDPDNDDHWAYFGRSRQRPAIEAVEEILGYHPDFQVLLDVWHKIQEEKK